MSAAKLPSDIMVDKSKFWTLSVWKFLGFRENVLRFIVLKEKEKKTNIEIDESETTVIEWHAIILHTKEGEQVRGEHAVSMWAG